MDINDHLVKSIGGVCKYISDQKTYLNTTPAFRFSEGATSYLLSTCFAVMCMSLINNVLRTTYSCTDQSVNMILNTQDPMTGTFSDPSFKESEVNSSLHDAEYLYLQFSYFSVLALSTLNVTPLYDLNFLDRFRDEKLLYTWLDNLDWKNPWLESNRVMFLCCLLQSALNLTSHEKKSLTSIIFSVLDQKQDTRTGLWGTAEGASLIEGVAGAYHFLIPYYFHNHPINNTFQLIDSTLQAIAFDYLFDKNGGGGACEDLDSIDILCKLTSYTEYKRETILSTLRNTLHVLLLCQNYDGGYSYRLNPFCYPRNVYICNYPTVKALVFNIFNYPIKRSHYYYTGYFSRWHTMPYAVNKSDMWSTLARLISLIELSKTLGFLNLNRTFRFLSLPGIGF